MIDPKTQNGWEWAIFMLACGFVPVSGLSDWLAGNPVTIALGVALAFIASGYLLGRSAPGAGRIGAVIALTGQAITMAGALQGHAWQLDAHMLFYALLAILVFLQSAPVLIAAAGLIAVHHLSLVVLLPSLIYPSHGLLLYVERMLVHAVIVVIETVALVATVLERTQAQSRDIGEVSRARGALDRSTRKNAADFDETTAPVGAVAERIGTLRALTDRFRTSGGRSGASRAA